MALKHFLWPLIAAATLCCAQALVSAQDQTGADPVTGRLKDDPARIAAGDAMVRRWELLTKQGKAALKKGDTPAAITLFEHRLTEYPDFETSMLLAGIYTGSGKLDDAIRVFRPLIYPGPDGGSYEAHLPTTRMKYVLALLDRGNWAEAAAVYEASFTGDNVRVYRQPTLADLKWSVPGYRGTAHTLPLKHFSVNDPDYAGLQAQAHLILGAREPQFIPTDDMPKYMLDHLKQALKYDPYSLDAHFISGILLVKMEKFKEARAEFQRTAKLAPDSAQAEIESALKNLDEHENKSKERAAWNAAHPPAKTIHPAQP